MGKSNFGELDESPPLLVNPQLMFTCLSNLSIRDTTSHRHPTKTRDGISVGRCSASCHSYSTPHLSFRPWIVQRGNNNAPSLSPFPPPFVHANPVSTKICSAPRGEYHTERRAENGGVEKPKLFENFFAFSVGKRVLNVFTIARVLATPNALMTTDASKGGFLSSLDCGEAHERREESSRGAKGARVARPQAGWLEEGEEGDGSGQGEKGRKTREWKKSGALLDRRSSRGACLPSAE